MTNVLNEVLANLRPRKTYHEQVSEICPCMRSVTRIDACRAPFGIRKLWRGKVV